jgi:ankyrin repeat protein
MFGRFFDKIKIFLEVGATVRSLYWIFILLLVAGSCNKSPQTPEDKLRQLGINYSSREFLKRAELGDATAIELFLEAGMDPNVRDGEYGVTALMLSANRNYTETMVRLLEEGAQTNIQCEDGNTALMYATIGGHINAVNVLLDHGAEVDAKDNRGLTALHIAALMGQEEVAKALIAKTFDLNAQDDHGRTALMFASINGFTKIVETLLSKSVETELEDTFGKTALQYAEERGHSDIVRLLKQATDAQ